jgi:glycosyltransferase involved in cell wall biosynthesis
MKILVVAHTFNNYGGIINHTENLIAGLKELDHHVTFAYLKNAKSIRPPQQPSNIKNDWEIGPGTGYLIHQGDGWIAPYLSYKIKNSVNDFVDLANKHDLLIWQSIFGFKNKDTENYTDWIPMIQNVSAKQIVVVHDANLKKLYPWIALFEKYFTGLACVHPSAYLSADFLNVPRALILNPQNVSNLPPKPSFANKKNKILSAQTFKRWKRVDDLIRAVPHMPNVHTIVAGNGIEAAYMMSKDKCKPEYFCTPQYDPDASINMLNNPIWKNAENSGNFQYLNFISESTRDHILSDSKFLLDPSWSHTFGEHFNRVVVDAMKTGTVPIAVNYGVSDNEYGIGTLLKPNENYCMLKNSYTPLQYANKIIEFCDMPESDYDRIVRNNYHLLKLFDRKTIAQQYIDLANHKPTGLLNELKFKSNNDPKIFAAANKMYRDHFESSNNQNLDSFFA